MSILLSPPVAFLIYVPLVMLVLLAGRSMAVRAPANPMKNSMYGSGEAPQVGAAAPGYRPFFLVAFFFAILHLGALVAGSGGLNLTTAIYLAGRGIALVALILG
jgi:NADH:ubiquinone oxidoreductase subunit 3 (subunit A)